MSGPLLELHGIRQKYENKALKVSALRGIDLEVHPGEQIAITGPSGCGKTTLLNILGLLDKPSSGLYQLAGQATEALDDESLSHLRNQHIGFIFQSYNLIENLTLAENVALPLMYRNPRPSPQAMLTKAQRLLKRVGLQGRSKHRPFEVSGGQQQRCAIARALATDPRLILADEPTGALDSQSTQDVLDLLRSLNQEMETTLIVITHDAELASTFPRNIHMSDGHIVKDIRQS